jgi:transposase
MEQITTIGLDLAKNVFQVHGVDAAGKVLVRKQLRRAEVLRDRTAIMTAIGFVRARPILKPLEQWRNSILHGNRSG